METDTLAGDGHTGLNTRNNKDKENDKIGDGDGDNLRSPEKKQPNVDIDNNVVKVELHPPPKSVILQQPTDKTVSLPIRTFPPSDPTIPKHILCASDRVG